MKEVSWKKFCKVLEAHGWVLQMIKGSHHINGKEGEVNKISVPVHGNKSIKRGLLNYFMGVAGLTEQDL
jgi:predicted RNA binding protein YcfA (HicA-like mRNA interferase family)